MAARVIVVGSVNVDLVLRVPRLPRPGETVVGGTFERHHGGKGGNQAVAAARLGAATALIAAVGDDEPGRDARAALEREGVDVSQVRVLAGLATGVAMIVVGPDGDNQIAVASGANAALARSDVTAAFDRLAPSHRDIVLVGHEVATVATVAALQAARSRRATSILNPAPSVGLDRSVFALADIVTPNRGELAALAADEAARTGRAAPGADGEPVAAARSLIQTSAEGTRAGAIMVSLGAEGAVLVTATEVVDLPAARVEAIDSTGAGDALNGALAAALAAGLDLATAARQAVAAASLSTRAAGARAGLPTKDELDRFA